MQVGLVPCSGDGAMLSALASGLLAGLIETQHAEMMSIGDLIDNSNLVDQVVGEGEDERDEDVFKEDEEDEEEDVE